MSAEATARGCTLLYVLFTTISFADVTAFASVSVSDRFHALHPVVRRPGEIIYKPRPPRFFPSVSD
ncbi:hypothetical protein K443DRAFT_681501 [Laccaria amethystina LaAM-08-1]|uniref:Secreted protein n=1 Tax=Laccaria amethystina LaAM-08-1 TaxID=1095629 RepID=A0A0C9WXM5_9AGAR|nr:hypothetical protein K443DRAFT_681501 [Laccaria amethystina LaAM-08-1]